MAFADILVDRNCDFTFYPELEAIVAAHVKQVVYGGREDAEVTKAAREASSKWYMEVNVQVDTEDLPKYGWFIAESGLCVPERIVPADGQDYHYSVVPGSGLTANQLHRHEVAQGAALTQILAQDAELWNNPNFGWLDALELDPQRPPVGALVSSVVGGWASVDKLPEA